VTDKIPNWWIFWETFPQRIFKALRRLQCR
jgi:hypothetical protein